MKKNKRIIILLIIGFQLFAYIADAQLDAPNLTFSVPGSICSQYYSFFCIDGATGYEVNFSTYSDFSNDVQTIETDVCNFYFPLLYFDTNYYFKIRAYNETDTSAWSNVQTFTTYSYSSANTQMIENGNYNVTQTSIPCAIECWWEIDTTNTFNSPILSRDTTFEDHSIHLNIPFFYCSKYYVRVKSVTDIDTTPNWSYTSWNYATIPCSPTLSYPNNCTFTNSITDLKIVRFDQPARYQFELDTSIVFADVRLYEIPVTSDSDEITIEDLFFEKQHFWRVRAINEIDTSAWTSAFTFCMCGVTPLLPVNDSSGINTNTSISVISIGNVLGYIFDVDTVAEFNSSAFTSYSSSSSSLQLYNLDFGCKYYWRVKAFHSLDTSAFSEVWHFSTLQKPELISPANNAINQNLKVNLRAFPKAGMIKYEYQLSANSSFPTEETTLLSHTQYFESVQSPLLQFNTTYYWRARYINESDTSDWSLPFTFTTYTAPVLISPTNGSTEITVNQAMLQWQNIQYIDSYVLWISTTADFIEYEEYSQPFYGNIIYLSDLLPSTTYYWKVKAITSSGESNWSETWSFTTQNTSKLDLLDQDYTFQIFPNPSSNDFTVKVSLPNYQNAEIKIAGLNGHLKSVIPVTGETTIIPTKGWKTGVYVCNLFINERLIKTEKLVFE